MSVLLLQVLAIVDSVAEEGSLPVINYRKVVFKRQVVVFLSRFLQMPPVRVNAATSPTSCFVRQNAA